MKNLYHRLNIYIKNNNAEPIPVYQHFIREFKNGELHFDRWAYAFPPPTKQQLKDITKEDIEKSVENDNKQREEKMIKNGNLCTKLRIVGDLGNAPLEGKNGDIVFNKNTKKLEVYYDGVWW